MNKPNYNSHDQNKTNAVGKYRKKCENSRSYILRFLQKMET